MFEYREPVTKANIQLKSHFKVPKGLEVSYRHYIQNKTELDLKKKRKTVIYKVKTTTIILVINDRENI